MKSAIARPYAPLVFFVVFLGVKYGIEALFGIYTGRPVFPTTTLDVIFDLGEAGIATLVSMLLFKKLALIKNADKPIEE